MHQIFLSIVTLSIGWSYAFLHTVCWNIQKCFFHGSFFYSISAWTEHTQLQMIKSAHLETRGKKNSSRCVFQIMWKEENRSLALLSVLRILNFLLRIYSASRVHHCIDIQCGVVIKVVDKGWGNPETQFQLWKLWFGCKKKSWGGNAILMPLDLGGIYRIIRIGIPKEVLIWISYSIINWCYIWALWKIKKWLRLRCLAFNVMLMPLPTM